MLYIDCHMKGIMLEVGGKLSIFQIKYNMIPQGRNHINGAVRFKINSKLRSALR